MSQSGKTAAPQIIEQDGKPAFVVLPIEEWRRIREQLEDAADVRAYDEAKARKGELFPASVVDALLADENPVRVYRSYRKMTQRRLADAGGIAAPYLNQIESGKRKPTTDVLKKLATALRVTVDDLI